MPPRPAPRQLPLDLGHRAGFSRDDLVVTAANQDAVTYIERWPDWASPVTILAGPPGSGKSHLAAIWRERADAATIDPTAIEVPDDQRIVALVEHRDLPQLDQTGLFHLINAVRATGGSLLITARAFSAAWGVTLPDLASRLKAAATVEIQEPDDALLAGVIAKLFADRQVEVEPHVVQSLARRIERSLSTVNAVVEQLDRAALQKKTRITRALALEVVESLDDRQGRLDIG
ncbi:MAG: DnaA regulatory inactivator HdaA [Rhizobiaceae bacterium]